MFKERLIKYWLRPIHICLWYDPYKSFFSNYFLKGTFCFETNSPSIGLLSSIIFFNWYQSYVLKDTQDHSFCNKMGSKQITFKEGASLNWPLLFEGEHFYFWQERMNHFKSQNWNSSRSILLDKCWIGKNTLGTKESTEAEKAVAVRLGGLIGHSLIICPSFLQ